MTQEAGVPADFWKRVEQVAERVVDKYARSGSTRNSSMTGGRFTIKGGALVVEGADGGQSAYFGGVTPNLPDGTYQPGFILKREDGTIAAAMYDPFPEPDGPGDYKQFFAIYDRSFNALFQDDTLSGQGMARPNLPFTAYPSRSSDWPVVTSTSFTTVYRAKGLKQQPRLYVETWANALDAGAVAEVRVLVNNVQMGGTAASTPGFVTGLNFGPLAVAGAHRTTLSIEIQYRLASGTGNVECGVGRIEGWQS